MKLLLTSSGISNRQIAAALLEMLDQPPGQTKVGFIPTAANAEENNKDWVISQLLGLWRQGFNQIDIVDFSADDIDWRARLDKVDMLWLTGGNTFHLLNQARKSGFDDWLKQNIDRKVYVGGSASSILMTPTIAAAGHDNADPNLPGLKDLRGLEYVDFEIMPHCKPMDLSSVEKYADKAEHPVYAIDDETAIKVTGDGVEVISSGYWKLYQ